MTDAKRRDRILANAARLFCEQGVAVTTVREIADAVGLNSGSLYYHFASKHAIATEILVQFLADLNRGYARVIAGKMSARERIRDILQISLEVASAHPYASEIYRSELTRLPSFPQYEQISAAAGRTHDAWTSVIESGIDSGELRSDIDSFDMQQALHELTFAFIRGRHPIPIAEIPRLADSLTSMWLDGCRTSTQTGAPGTSVRQPTSRIRPATKSEPDRPSNEVEELRSELETLRIAMTTISQNLPICVTRQRN